MIKNKNKKFSGIISKNLNGRKYIRVLELYNLTDKILILLIFLIHMQENINILTSNIAT